MLIVKDLKKTYPSFSLDCTLEVPDGRITGLIGQNGAGKTTLFKLILGLIFKDSGSVTVLGKEPSSLSDSDRQRLGVVLAESGFSGYLTVKSVCTILKAFYPDFDERFFMDSCARNGLKPDQQIKEFSTGMKAKLKVISALSHKAEFLLLDEPTSGLDVIARDEVLALIRDYMASNETNSVLISSHISSDLEHLCDDIYMIHEGRIVLHEDTDTLLSDYAVLKVSDEEFENLDKSYLLRKVKEPFGWSCLTDKKAFYVENYPDIVIERSGIDELMQNYIKGESL
ncbi:MAG: ABC transporter ATP-binding protein [Oscillospiraceae bacterium]|nr:ABC transporter ATP-binding protein [Oscillospiraceae bacterium]